MTIWKGIWRPARPDPAAGLGDLEAGLRTEGCPVCARAAGADERWLDHFLYEGYQEPEVMAAVARGGGFCAHHARRLDRMGLSATVALIYLILIADCLPRLAARRPTPLFAAPGTCEACAQAHEVERRECFFLALLIRARCPAVYGSPGVVCTTHLPQLVEYLDDGALADVVAVHSRTAAAFTASLADSAVRCGAPADRAIRAMLGPPRRPAAVPPGGKPDAFGAGSDTVRRMRRRLRHLDGCAVCAEIADAAAQWLDWLALAPAVGGNLADVLPLCRDHVWQARLAGGPVLGEALATAVTREAEERLLYVRQALDRAAGSGFVAAVRRAVPGSARRAAVLQAMGQGRQCPLCRHLREVGERAILLLVALLESADGRRAFETGYGLCVRHAAQALALPQAAAVAGIVAATIHARLAVLRWELEEQLRRGAWQARPARRGAEAGAWLRAGPRFAGTGVGTAIGA